MIALLLWTSLSLSQAPAPMPQAEIDAARKLERTANDLYRAGRYLDAEKPLQEAIALWTKHLGPDDVEALNDTVSVALTRRRRGDAVGAIPLLRRAVEGLARCQDPDAPELRHRALNELAMAYQYAGKPGDARATWEGLLQQLRAGGPELAEEQVRVLDRLAALLLSIRNLDVRNLDAAEKYSKQALAAWRVLRGEGDDVDVAISGSILGTVAMFKGDLATARRYLEDALRVHETIGGVENPNMVATLNLLAALEEREGRRAAAQAAYRRSLEIAGLLQMDPRNQLVVDAKKGLELLDRAPDAGR